MEKHNSKRKLNKAAIVLLIFLIVIVLSFTGLYFYVKGFNSKKHSVDVNLDKWGQSEMIDSAIVGVAPRGGITDTWTKDIDVIDANGNTETMTYRGTIYDFYVENHNENQYKEWSIKFTADELMYLNNAWCGRVEIHQNVGTDKEYVQTLDLRNPGTVNLETRRDSDDLMIILNAGDYFIYKPDVITFEVPLRGKNNGLPGKVTCGFILYTPDAGDTSQYTFSSVVLNYDTTRNMREYPLFWILCLLSLCWIVSAFASIITEIRVAKVVREREKDEQIIRQTMETFTGFIDAKDPYTRGHSLRVAQYSAMIAARMKLSAEEVQNVYYIALLHDSGKIGIPEEVLSKPGKLTPEEYEVMKMHTVKGYEILSNYTSIPNVAVGAKYHHERYDGKGYPEGLVGEDIPLVARIICVADSFDAMNSDRVYRRRIESDKIMTELVNNKGKQFDPRVVDEMMSLLIEGKIQCGE